MSQGRGNAGVEIFCEVRSPTRGLCSMGRGREHRALTKAARKVPVKDAPASLRI